MIPAEIIHRVFYVRSGYGTGTAFAIDVDGRQYLVTAKHVLEPNLTSPTIEIWENGGWVPLPVSVVGHGGPDIDISVLAANHLLAETRFLMTSSSAGMTYGQDVYFLGFPFGIVGRFLRGPGHPFPLVKRAILSLFIGGEVFLLDGHNNPGFSGGPVVFRDLDSTTRVFKIAAVISGFLATEEPVFHAGQPTPPHYRTNTGIIVCHPIEHATNVIAQNPIGFQLPT
jgi:S1-C subfamily serine protease